MKTYDVTIDGPYGRVTHCQITEDRIVNGKFEIYGKLFPIVSLVEVRKITNEEVTFFSQFSCD